MMQTSGSAEYSTVVVGSGAGGLTLALLLAKTGRRVVLVESQRTIGGYLRCFKRDGFTFDTGYHFSGGFTGILSQMLRILDLDDAVTGTPVSNRIVLAESGHDILLPAGCGHNGAAQICSRAFPADEKGVLQYFELERSIWETTPMHDLADLSEPDFMPGTYDLLTVDQINSRLGLSPAAAACAGSFAMCHGTPPAEAPMTFHARTGYALHNDLSRPDGGGDTMIRAFLRELEKYHVDIRTGTELLKCTSAPDCNGEIHRIFLSDGSDVMADQVFFAVHPRVVRDVLPDAALTPSFLRRLNRLKETCSFFCSCFALDARTEPGLVSFFSGNDLNDILSGSGRSHSTGILFHAGENGTGTACAFRTMPCMAPGQDYPATHAERLKSAVYQDFKASVSADIEREILQVRPELKGHLRLIADGSPLTCLDYDPPTGSAYGARCVCGQTRTAGRLPVGNFYLAGQSAVSPGILGTMSASFSVFRQAVGEGVYRELVLSGLEKS